MRMPVHIRRSAHVFFAMRDQPALDINLLLRGGVGLTSRPDVLATSVPAMAESPVDVDLLPALLSLPADRWTPCARFANERAITPDTLHALLDQGVIIGDSDQPRVRELRARDEALSSSQWHQYAALYHFLCKWRDVDLRLAVPPGVRDGTMTNFTRRDVVGEALTRDFIATYGKPPGHFVTHPKAVGTRPLPLAPRNDGVFGVLTRRKTTRVFDGTQSLGLEQLSTVLYYVYGCHGYLPVFEDVVGLKRTSPSGGDLHPTEVYPLVIDVHGLEPGLYHYNAEHHRLDLIEPLDEHEARELANQFTAGQSYPSSAHALFVMTTRFYRNYWKYRRHPRAYSVLLMDAAHLSQTFYLVCTELGLGAFVTAAINAGNIEERLGLDGFVEGAVLICGCGVPVAGKHGMQPDFLSYAPGEDNPSVATG
jgi:putative peptide maturation dehydrogenase